MAKTKTKFDLLESYNDFPILQPNKRPRINAEKIKTCQEVYIIAKSLEENKKLTDLSIFGVQKGLECITKNIIKVSPQRNGELLILTSTKAAAGSLIKAKTLGGLCAIECVEHPFLNSSRAKIYCPAIMNLEENEITAGLKDEGVIGTRKIKKWKEGVLVNTPLVILTFNTPVIPDDIKVGYLNIKTELYIPNPLRCTTCQRFGHGKKRCAELKELPKCGLCAEILTPPDDIHEQCKKTPKCVNCGENHGSFSRDCIIYKAEAEITKIKTVDRVSYRTARQRYAELTRTQNQRTTKEAASSSAENKTTVSSDSISKITQKTEKSNNTFNKILTQTITKPNTPKNEPNNTIPQQNKSNINDKLITPQTNINKPLIDQNIIEPVLKNNINLNSIKNPFEPDSKKRTASQLTRLSETERALYENYCPME